MCKWFILHLHFRNAWVQLIFYWASLILCAVICVSLYAFFVLFLLVIVLSVFLRFTRNDYCLSPSEQFLQRYNGGFSYFWCFLMYIKALRFSFKLLTHWINGSQSDVLLQSDTLSWFRSNHSLHSLFDFAFWFEKHPF